jgi:lysophospholipase L1-like esterase
MTIGSRLFGVFAVAGFLAAASARPVLGAEKRIICFGDSITKKGYPEVLAKMLGIEVLNAGVGGNTTAAGLRRMEQDVIDRKPSVVVIFFGTNDCRLAEPQVTVPVDQYQKNLEEMIARSRRAGAKAVICTPPPIDSTAYFKRHKKEPFDKAGGLDKVLGEYRAAAIRAAQSAGVRVVDLNTLLADKTDWRAADGVHPTDKGTQMIADFAAQAVKPLLSEGESQTK